MTTLVLLHSPLTTAAVWGPLPDALRAEVGDLGVADVHVVDVRGDGTAPFGTRYVAEVARSLATAAPESVVLVAHSGAGPLVPAIASTQRAAHRPVRGYVFLDAGLPRVRPGSRLDLLHDEDEAFAHELEARLRTGERFPTWSPDDLRGELPDEAASVVAGSLRSRGLDFFSERLPPVVDWPDAPASYVRLSAPYDVHLRTAGLRGWATTSLDLGHFGWWREAAAVAGTVRQHLS